MKKGVLFFIVASIGLIVADELSEFAVGNRKFSAAVYNVSEKIFRNVSRSTKTILKKKNRFLFRFHCLLIVY